MRDKSGFGDRQVESLLRGGSADPGLSDALTALRAEGTGPAPAPNAGLAALLSEGFVPLQVPPARPSRRGLSIGLIAVGASSALLLTATGANALPASGQRAVAGVLNAISPFDFPMPDADEPRAPEPAPEPTPVKIPAERPTEEPSDEPSDEPSSRDTESDGRGEFDDDQPGAPGQDEDTLSGDGDTTSEPGDTPESGSSSGPSTDSDSTDSPVVDDAEESDSSSADTSSDHDDPSASDTP